MPVPNFGRYGETRSGRSARQLKTANAPAPKLTNAPAQLFVQANKHVGLTLYKGLLSKLCTQSILELRIFHKILYGKFVVNFCH